MSGAFRTPAPADPTLVRIATRGSALALAQARLVQARCREAFPGLRFELKIIKTTGDKRQQASLANPAASLPKGLFTKELENALLRGDADFAVHSLKDLPTGLPAGLRLGAVLEREDPRDVLVLRSEPRRRSRSNDDDSPLARLRRGAVVATSSTRRTAQLLDRRPDLRCVEIRGNVPTRLRKLATDPELDATLLAAAGLARLGIRPDDSGILICPPSLADEAWPGRLVALPLDPDLMIPAVGQAAIGLEGRIGDRRIASVFRRLDHRTTHLCVLAERAFLSGFGGGCHSPVAAWATLHGDRLRLNAIAFDGPRVWRQSVSATVRQARSVGRTLGQAARRALRLAA